MTDAIEDATSGHIERVSLTDLDETRTALFDGEPKTVRLALDADEAVPPHTHPGRTIVFHLLDGELDLTVGESTLSLSAGEVVRFAGREEISLSAVSHCEALLVLAPD